MHDGYSNYEKKLSQRFRQKNNSNNPASNRWFTPQLINGLLAEHPELRLKQDPVAMQIIQRIMEDPEDEDVQEMLASIVDKKNAEYLDSGDVFWGNYPPAGSIVYPPDFMEMGRMPTNDPVGHGISQTSGNILYNGPTGCGKTSLLSKNLANPILLNQARVVTFARKRELRHLATIPGIAHKVLTFQLEDMKLAFFEHPPGVTDMAWNNDLARTTAHAIICGMHSLKPVSSAA